MTNSASSAPDGDSSNQNLSLDELVSQLERFSQTRLENQRTSLPPMVSQGVASMGWQLRPQLIVDPETETLMDQLERACGRRLVEQSAGRSGLSSLLVTYQQSIDASSPVAEDRTNRLNLRRMVSQDAAFSRQPKKSAHDSNSIISSASSLGRSVSLSNLSHSAEDQPDNDPGEEFDEQRSLLPSSIKCHHSSGSELPPDRKSGLFERLSHSHRNQWLRSASADRRSKIPFSSTPRAHEICRKQLVGLGGRRTGASWKSENLAMAS